MKNWLSFGLGLTFAFSLALAQKVKVKEVEGPQGETKQLEIKAPEVGKKAPDFELPIATKDTIIFEGKRLYDWLGKGPVVLAFYPADWSGGCTKEVCTLRDGFSEFEKLGATVIGISGDYVFSHQQWAAHHRLPFYLASDHLGKVSRQFGSYDPESGYNKRTVYVLDKDGIVRFKNMQFKAGSEEDYRAVQEALAAIK